jgi:hypothetical protein
MKAQKFTYTKILNIHGSQPLCGWVCVWECMGGWKIFPASVSVRYFVPNHASQEWFLEVSNFGFCLALLFCRSRVLNILGGNIQHLLNMPSVGPSVMIHVSMWIIDLLEMISMQVLTSGTDSGGLGFTCSLVVCLPSNNFGGKMSLHMYF